MIVAANPSSRASSAVHATQKSVGPQDLLAVVQRDHFERVSARVRGRERAVSRGMPILGEHDIGEALGQVVMTGTTSSPLGTARLPPGMNEFCTSTTIRTADASGMVFGYARDKAAASRRMFRPHEHYIGGLRLETLLAEIRLSRWRSYFSLLSGTVAAAAWKPILEWVPSQNGFLVEAPQRHRNTVGWLVSTRKSP
jgi:hypothetical protein